MENPCKIILYGDSILKESFVTFEKAIRGKYHDIQLEVLDRCTSGITSLEAEKQLASVIAEHPEVIILGFGMNDWRKGVDENSFEKCLLRMTEELQRQNIRTILMTIIPDFHGRMYEESMERRRGTSPEIDSYNRMIIRAARRRKIRVAEVNALWKRQVKPLQKGLMDAFHPNDLGRKIITRCLMQVVPRQYTTVLWQFNGKYAACNYACEYCYVPTSVNTGHHFNGNLAEWHDAFRRNFGNEYITFYLSFGEPTIGKHFHEIVDMIGSEPNWNMMMTSNLSTDFTRLLNSRLASDGRLNINASFHPTQTSRETFLEKLLLLRSRGIEPPVIYVMYPPLMEQFEDHFRFFNAHGFVMHVRRFCGFFKGKRYPGAYTQEQKHFIARYMDTASIRYMLNYKSSFGRLSYIGMYLILVNNRGDVEMCDGYIGDGSLGNVFQGNVNLKIEPEPFPGLISLGSVDDIACFSELEYRELEDNHVLTFASQGGVYKDKEGVVHYPHINEDFDKSGTFEKISHVADPGMERKRLMLNFMWIINHLIRATAKKYLRHALAFAGGKIWLLKKGRLRWKGFYHS